MPLGAKCPVGSKKAEKVPPPVFAQSREAQPEPRLGQRRGRRRCSGPEDSG